MDQDDAVAPADRGLPGSGLDRVTRPLLLALGTVALVVACNDRISSDRLDVPWPRLGRRRLCHAAGNRAGIFRSDGPEDLSYVKLLSESQRDWHGNSPPSAFSCGGSLTHLRVGHRLPNDASGRRKDTVELVVYYVEALPPGDHSRPGPRRVSSDWLVENGNGPWRITGAGKPDLDPPHRLHLCSRNCGIEVEVRDGRLATVRGDAASPLSVVTCARRPPVSTTIRITQTA